MSEIKILVDIGGSASSLKDVISDLEKLRDVSEEIRVKKGKLIEAKGSEDVAKLTAEIESLRAKYEKLTAEKVKAKQGTSELDKALAKLTKAQSDEGKELAKVNQQIKETNQLNKIQGGILGDLLKKRKQLQESIVTAKSREELKRLNQELFRTNLEIGKIKQDGVKAFNSWGNALTSFQFKFNALGNIVGGFAAGALAGLVDKLTEFGIEGAKAFFESAKGAGVFGQSIKDATINTASLQGALDSVEKQLSRIGKGQREIVSEALGFGLEAKKLELESAQRAANAIGITGLSEEDKQKVLTQRQEIADQIAAVDAQIELKRIEAKKKSIEEQVQITKDGTDAELAAVRLSFERQLSLLLGGKDKSGTQDERLVRVEALNKAIEDINIEQGKRAKERKDKLLKQEIEDDKKAAELRLKAESNEADENFRIWQTTFKKKQDEEERIRKEIMKAEEEQRKQEEAQREYEQQQQEEEDKINKENIARAAKEALDARKKALEEEAELRERFANAAFEGMQERNERELQANADKLTELDKQLAFQRELALKGEVNTLQEVEKARAEALAEKAAMEKKAANLAKGEKAAEIFLEFYKAYANEKEGAFMKALTATAKGKGGEAVVKALFSGSFYDGTEDTGKGGDLDAKGGFGAILHPHERILTRAHNEAIGDISNEEVVRRVNLFEDMPVADKRIDVQVNESLNRALHAELKRIAKAVENPAYIDIQRNYLNELVSIEQRLGAKIETTHKRIGSSYSRD